MSDFLFPALGTGGDVAPAAAVAAELQRRGHDVRVLSFEPHRALVASYDVPFRSIASESVYFSQITDPDHWNPSTRSTVMDENGYIRAAIDPAYREVSAAARTSPVIVCTRNAFGARMAADVHGLPIVGLAYSATQYASAERPPWSRPALAKQGMAERAGVFRELDAVQMDPLRAQVNRFMREYALPEIVHMREWYHFGIPTIALYGAWYDDVSDLGERGVVQADFVAPSEAAATELPDVVKAFLADGEPPVVFTFGTGVAHLREVFDAADASLRRSARRGIFVSRFTESLPDVRDGTLNVEHADFSELLPRCRLLVHHGGIGTAFDAVRAGIPQVIAPLAFDQFDNAFRFASLGLAERVDGALSEQVLTEVIERAIGSVRGATLETYRAMARSAAGAARAADICESIAERGATAPALGAVKRS